MQTQSQISGGTQLVQTHQQQPSCNVNVRREKYKTSLFGLGVAEVVVGSLSILLAIISLIVAGANSSSSYYYNRYRYPYYYYNRNEYQFTWPSQGLWCGVFAIVTGFLGIKSKSNPSVCMYNTNMTLSIITIVFMAVQLILSSLAAATSRQSGMVAVHALLAVLGFVGFVIGIVHSAFCCAGVCCGTSSRQGTVSYAPQLMAIQQPQRMVQLPNGQCAIVPSQPITAQYLQAPVFGNPSQENGIAPTQVTSYAASPSHAPSIPLPSTDAY